MSFCKSDVHGIGREDILLYWEGLASFWEDLKGILIKTLHCIPAQGTPKSSGHCSSQDFQEFKISLAVCSRWARWLMFSSPYGPYAPFVAKVLLCNSQERSKYVAKHLRAVTVSVTIWIPKVISQLNPLKSQLCMLVCFDDGQRLNPPSVTIPLGTWNIFPPICVKQPLCFIHSMVPIRKKNNSKKMVKWLKKGYGT